MTSAQLPACRTFARIPNVDTTFRALAASGALIVDMQEFHTCGENGGVETHLVGIRKSSVSVGTSRTPGRHRSFPRVARGSLSGSTGQTGRNHVRPKGRRNPSRCPPFLPSRSDGFPVCPVSDWRPCRNEDKRLLKPLAYEVSIAPHRPGNLWRREKHSPPHGGRLFARPRGSTGPTGSQWKCLFLRLLHARRANCCACHLRRGGK